MFNITSTGPKSRCHQGHTPSRGSRGEPVPYLFQILVVAGTPVLVATSFQSLPLSSHSCLLPSSLLCSYLILSYLVCLISPHLSLSHQGTCAGL